MLVCRIQCIMVHLPCSLIKMLYCICKQSKQVPTWNELKYAILRNFGGRDDFDPTVEFHQILPEHFWRKVTY